MNTNLGTSRSEEDDARLVGAALDGDRKAAGRLFRRHAEALYAFALVRTGRDRALAEDVVQETFLDAWRNLDRFDRERCFPAWLTGIARRKLARVFRGRERAREVDPDRVLAFLAADGPGVAERLESEEAGLAVTDVLARLPAGPRRLLLAKYRDGRSLAEIASELGIRPEAVSSRLQRARAAFRSRLKGVRDDDAAR